MRKPTALHTRTGTERPARSVVPLTHSDAPSPLKASFLSTAVRIGPTESGRASTQALRQSEERLRLALTISNIGVFDLNLRDQTAVRSQEHGRIFGYSKPPRRWSYKMFLEHVVPEDRAMVDQIVRQALGKQTDLSFECRIRRADGKVRWIWVVARHRGDAGERPHHLTGIVQDITERKWTRDALQKASQLNQQIISGAMEGIIVYGPDLRYLVWNPFMEQLTGMPAAQVLGKKPLEVFPFLQRAGVISHLRRVMAGQDAGPVEFHFEVSQTHRSGWVSDTNSALRDASGRIVGVIGLVRDISERRKAEEHIAQLSRARAILSGVDRAIVRNADRQKLLDEVCRLAVREGGFKLAWVGMVTAGGIVRPVAKAGATGYLRGIRIVTRDEPAGRGPTGTAIRENRVVVVGHFAQDRRTRPWLQRARRFGLSYSAAFPLRMAGKPVGAFQVYAPRPDFYDRAELSLLTQVSEDISYALTALADLDARRQAEAELRRSQRDLARFFELAPVGLVRLSAKGTILWANRQQLEWLGYSPQEYLGRPFVRFCVEPAQGRHLLHRLQAGGSLQNLRMEGRCRNGSIRHLLVSANALRGDGRLRYFSIFLRDITDRVLLERDLRQVAEREHRRVAQDLHDGLGQLLAATAYLAGTVRQELTTQGSPQAQQVSRIQEVIQEAITTTRSLARGLHPVEPGPGGLMAALRALARRTQDLFEVACRFVCPRPVLVRDTTCATHLFRIAQEAVTNAIKHSRAKRIEIKLRKRLDRLQLEIRDNGRGVGPGTGKTLGAGLRIMHHRAGILGGSVAFQRRPGYGTTVSCSVPVSNQQLGGDVQPA